MQKKLNGSMNVAVLIPCYNEGQTIQKVVRDYKEAFPNATVYVYDNNSTDDTYKLAEKAGAEVHVCKQQGKGNVIRQMFREIEADCYIMTDGDDTYPPVPEMVQYVVDGHVDMVVGDRLSSTYFTENKRPFHNSGNRVVRWLINKLFDVQIHDIMTGSRAFSRQFVKTFPVLSKGFEIETEMSIHAAAHNMLIKEIPVDYRDRPEGSVSKLNTYSDGAKVLGTIISLFKNYCPFKFFGLLSLFLVILATAFVIPVCTEFAATGIVRRFPTLIVCGFVYLTAIVSLFSGLILSSINKKERQEFEWRLVQLEIMKQGSMQEFNQMVGDVAKTVAKRIGGNKKYVKPTAKDAGGFEEPKLFE